MKVLVSSLPDIQRIPVQRPHHLLKYLAERHEVVIRCIQSLVRETFVDRVSYAGTPWEIASSLSYFIDHRDAASAVGAANREFVMRGYTWESICTRFDRVMDGVISHATIR